MIHPEESLKPYKVIHTCSLRGMFRDQCHFWQEGGRVVPFCPSQRRQTDYLALTATRCMDFARGEHRRQVLKRHQYGGPVYNLMARCGNFFDVHHINGTK